MFGTVFRSILVIGAVYALSPTRGAEEPAARSAVAPSTEAQTLATRAAPTLEDLVAAAGRLCTDDPAACANAAKTFAGVAAAASTIAGPAAAPPAPAPSPQTTAAKSESERFGALLEATARTPGRTETKNRAN